MQADFYTCLSFSLCFSCKASIDKFTNLIWFMPHSLLFQDCETALWYCSPYNIRIWTQNVSYSVRCYFIQHLVMRFLLSLREPVVNDSGNIRLSDRCQCACQQQFVCPDVLIIQGKSQFSIELGDIIVFRNESNPFWRQSGSMGYVDSFLSSYQSKYNVLVRKVHNKQDSNGNTRWVYWCKMDAQRLIVKVFRFLVCTEERDLTMAEKVSRGLLSNAWLIFKCLHLFWTIHLFRF